MKKTHVTPLLSKLEITSNVKWSLRNTLTVWFLLTAMIPLCTVLWIVNSDVKSSLVSAAESQLVQSANSNNNFIQNWFDYRFMDIKAQAKSYECLELLETLSEGLSVSGQEPQEYVLSINFAERARKFDEGLRSMAESYDYVRDLYLID